MKHLLIGVSIFLVLSMGLGSGVVWAENGPTARSLSLRDQADGLRVTILKASNGSFLPVDPASVFHEGDEIKIRFESNFDGTVYVLNETPRGRKHILFPRASDLDETRNAVSAWKQYTLPADKVFTFDDEKGVETLLVVMARAPIPEFDRAIRSSKGELGAPGRSDSDRNGDRPTVSQPRTEGREEPRIVERKPSDSTSDDEIRKAADEAKRSVKDRIKQRLGGIFSRGFESLDGRPAASRAIVIGPGKNQEKGGDYIVIADRPDRRKGERATVDEPVFFEIRLEHR